MENFKKYDFNETGQLINVSSGKLISPIKGSTSYCLYNDSGERKTVKKEHVLEWLDKKLGVHGIEKPKPERRKLSAEQIKSIYASVGSTESVALKFGVLNSTVSKIRNNQTFTKITSQCNK